MLQIRSAVPDDATEMGVVHVDSWRDAYRGIVSQDYLDGLVYVERQQRWRRILSDMKPLETVLVAHEDDRMAGFLSGGANRDGESAYQAEMYAIYLSPDRKGSGIGRRLVAAFVEFLRDEGLLSMNVWVLADNSARGFYERLGGMPAGEKEVSIGGETLRAVAYGWADLEASFG